MTVSSDGSDGCTHAGTEQIPLVPQLGLFTLNGTTKPYQYQIVALWGNTLLSGGVSDCPEAGANELVPYIPPATAIQSGDTSLGTNPYGLVKASPDGVTFDGGASEADAVVGSANWTWSLKGSP